MSIRQLFQSQFGDLRRHNDSKQCSKKSEAADSSRGSHHTDRVESHELGERCHVGVLWTGRGYRTGTFQTRQTTEIHWNQHRCESVFAVVAWLRLSLQPDDVLDSSKDVEWGHSYSHRWQTFGSNRLPTLLVSRSLSRFGWNDLNAGRYSAFWSILQMHGRL